MLEKRLVEENKVKLIIRICAIFLIIGLGLMIAGFTLGTTIDDVTGIFSSDSTYEEKSYTATEIITGLVIDADARSVDIKQGAQDFVTVDYHQSERESVLIDVVDGRLEITLRRENRNWYDWFSLGWPSDEVVTIYVTVPATSIISVDVEVTAGDIEIAGNYLETVLEAFAGDIDVQGHYAALDIEIMSGDITLSNVLINESIVIESVSGEISVSDALISENLEVFGVNGDMTLTDVIVAGHIDLEVFNGHIDLINSGGTSIKLKSASGNIHLDLNEVLEEVQYKLSVLTGSISINGIIVSNPYNFGEGILIEAETITGNITIQSN